jgi:hypothetical protein
MHNAYFACLAPADGDAWAKAGEGMARPGAVCGALVISALTAATA